MNTGGTSSPQQFGKYLLLERIAVGGMAEIFRAKKLGAEGFEKELVIKRVLPHFSEDDSFITMFKDEARIAANLNHSNICQVFEFDQLEDSFYLAMEYIAGEDLKSAIETGAKRDFPLTVTQITWIGAQVAAGLHYAHQKEYAGEPLNIVHRDVTPHNIMLSREGDVKLMDFGIAKAAARSTRTQAGTVKGKCAYMSPEQARGKDLDGRSDVFALGIVMWEALTGERLFLGETEFETLSNVLKRQIPDVRTFNADVPPRLKEILDKALARDAADRHEHAAAFERDLLGFFYQECDPNKVLLGETIQYLFEDGPRPDCGVPVAEPSGPQDVGNLETVAMPSVAGMTGGGSAPMPAPIPMPTGQGAGSGIVAPPPAAAPPPPMAPPPAVPPPPSAPHMGAPPQPTLPLEPVRSPPAAVDVIADAMAAPTDPMRPLDVSEPSLAAYTSSVETGPNKGLLVGVAAAIIVVLAIVGFFVFRGGGETEVADKPPTESGGVEKPPPTPKEVAKRMVRVVAKPAKAKLYVGKSADYAEKSPVEVEREVGATLRVRATARGYKSLRKKVEVVAGDGEQVVELVLKKK